MTDSLKLPFNALQDDSNKKLEKNKNFITNKNHYKETILQEWAETFLFRDPGNFTFIDQVYKVYSDYCIKKTQTIPFKRKRFAKFLKIHLNNKFTLNASVNPHTYVEWTFRNGQGVIIRGVKFQENETKRFGLDQEKPPDQGIDDPGKQWVKC